ncbi:FkbM family methyltransferase [Candidatus Nitrososphaera sp. FF02]|uniref:FkbM family methyltransferase n=1 Tax=Candidatus Nitrososphaera sp. FF02 TaxID=3398226 RepID=UPI0039EA7A05
MRTGLSDDSQLGSNLWWLKETRGATLTDKLILSFLKSIFRATRFSLKIVMGKKKRDALYARRNISFKSFLYKATAPFGSDKVSLEISVPKHDYKVHCPLNREDFIVMTQHEDEIIERFTPRQGATVVDIGAHMGRYTIIGSKRVGPNGKVVAIEAHAGNFRLLDSNIELNRLSNVVAINSAVYSRKTSLKLYLPDEDQGYTMHHSVMAGYLSTKYRDVEQKYASVKADTLDNLLSSAGIESVNWIKIDVEGAELEVLKGACDTLRRNNDITLLIEVHGQETYEPVLALLKLHDFELEFEKTYDNGEKHLIANKHAQES